MGKGNSFYFEEPAAEKPVVYSTLSASVMDEYNDALMCHMSACQVTSPGRFGWREGEQEAITHPDTGGSYPKLVGNAVMHFSFETGQAVEPANSRQDFRTHDYGTKRFGTRSWRG